MTTVTNHDTQTTNEVLEAALCYAGRGWPVLPVHSVREGRCTCGNAECDSPAKHPHTPHGVKDVTTDEAVIRRWWVRWPDANVAIRTGPESGLFVVDIDTKNDGPETLAKLIEEHGELPPSIEEVTGSDAGRHRADHTRAGGHS